MALMACHVSHADGLIQYIDLKCEETTGYLGVGAKIVHHDINYNADNEITKGLEKQGLYQIRNLVKTPFKCEIDNNVFSVSVTDFVDTRMKGMCITEMYGQVSVKRNDDVVAKFSVPRRCGKTQGWSEVDVTKNKMNVCTYIRQDGPKEVYEQKCNYTFFKDK